MADACNLKLACICKTNAKNDFSWAEKFTVLSKQKPKVRRKEGKRKKERKKENDRKEETNKIKTDRKKELQDCVHCHVQLAGSLSLSLFLSR